MAGKVATVSLIVLFAVVVRWCVSLNKYSGYGKAPMFGDYEAQRHWMEITYNLPVKEWYRNSSRNDLQYWGLDYPPLTAYHSWLCAAVAKRINPSWIDLFKSRGFESQDHKLFMRSTVLVADLLIYFTGVISYFLWGANIKTTGAKMSGMAAMLLYPGLILIDYGHFQYNCVSLGLVLWAVALLCSRHELLGASSFCLALNYKQMELYHATPFFCYLLGRCCTDRAQNGLWRLIKLGVTVIVTFALCWLPFLSEQETTLQVLHRLFPFARGIFEDKVANIWCASSIFIKWKNIFTLEQLVKYCLLSTAVYLSPSSLDLLLRPSLKKFRLALINSSLVFFLFSFQVHEKSILIAALPACLLLPKRPFQATWFLLISTFSMLPLLIKDELVLPYIATSIMFYIVVKLLYFCDSSPAEEEKISETRIYENIFYWLSMFGAVILTVVTLYVKPPSRYPDLWTVLVSIYSCGHFICFLIYFHWLQFRVKDSDSNIHSPKNTPTKAQSKKKD